MIPYVFPTCSFKFLHVFLQFSHVFPKCSINFFPGVSHVFIIFSNVLLECSYLFPQFSHVFHQFSLVLPKVFPCFSDRKIITAQVPRWAARPRWCSRHCPPHRHGHPTSWWWWLYGGINRGCNGNYITHGEYLWGYFVNGNFRILNWRYVSTTCLAMFSGDIPLHRPEK